MYCQNPLCIQWWQHLLWCHHSMQHRYQLNHVTNLYNAGYPSIALMIKMFLQLTLHCFPHTVPLENPVDFPQQLPSKCTLTICADLDEDEEEEDFQTVLLEDDHWTTKEIPDRHLCIHKHSVPHELCPYPCPHMDYTYSPYYDTLDLSDIS